VKHGTRGASTGGEGQQGGGQHGREGGRARKDRAGRANTGREGTRVGKDWTGGSSTGALCTRFTLVNNKFNKVITNKRFLFFIVFFDY